MLWCPVPSTHEILCQENFHRILQESKEQQFVVGKTEGNINYFGSKLYGHNFIDNVMSGYILVVTMNYF